VATPVGVDRSSSHKRRRHRHISGTLPARRSVLLPLDRRPAKLLSTEGRLNLPGKCLSLDDYLVPAIASDLLCSLLTTHHVQRFDASKLRELDDISLVTDFNDIMLVATVYSAQVACS
jgi:hypothetical protein